MTIHLLYLLKWSTQDQPREMKVEFLKRELQGHPKGCIFDKVVLLSGRSQITPQVPVPAGTRKHWFLASTPFLSVDNLFLITVSCFT